MGNNTRLIFAAPFIAVLGGGCGGITGDPMTTPAGSDGGPGTGGDCSFTACGGNPVGTWTIRRICVAPQLVQHCSGASLAPKDVTASGTFVFGSDGTLTVDVTGTGAYEGTLPSSCVAGRDCASLTSGLNQKNAPPAACSSDNDGGCTCSAPVTSSQTVSVPYTVSGNTVGNMPFCVQSGFLKLENAAGTVFVLGQ